MSEEQKRSVWPLAFAFLMLGILIGAGGMIVLNQPMKAPEKAAAKLSAPDPESPKIDTEEIAREATQKAIVQAKREQRAALDKIRDQLRKTEVDLARIQKHTSDAKFEFGLMTSDEQQRAIEISHRFKIQGPGSLNDDDREFLDRYPAQKHVLDDAAEAKRN